MTRDELDVLWQKALHESVEAGEQFTRYRFATLVAANELERFSALVAAKEREECALVCESIDDQWAPVGYKLGTIDCAEAIRARKP